MMQTVGIFSECTFFEKIRFSNFLYRNHAVTTHYNNLKDKASFLGVLKLDQILQKLLK